MEPYNVLDLVLKHKWYDLIDSGEKKEEYREIKPYWEKRLQGKKYYSVVFHKGYSSIKMEFLITSIRKGVGNPNWGANGKFVYIISLGRRLK